MESSAPHGDSRAAFDVLYRDLKDFHKGAFNGGFKAIGFGLIILGWLVSSESAQAFFAGKPSRGYAAMLAVGLSSLIYVVATFRLYQMSSVTAKLLDALAFMPAANYSERRISRFVLLILCAANVLLATITSYIILQIVATQ